MALSQDARNKIKNLVQKSKKLLIDDFGAQLSQFYGILVDGSVEDIDRLTTQDSEVLHVAGLLRERLELIKTNIPDKEIREQEGVAQLIREQAFTVLNRTASLRMAEERGLILESIRKGYQSEGFQVYDQITGQAQTASQFKRYKWYLFAILDELALDLPSLFDRYSPYGLLFPSEKALLKLLELVNDIDLSIHREGGHQPINLWAEDETIGWIYQYYNSREEISAMRDASSAPRNSRELAVRNQFFTPRYVVQFLVDNSLGRQWYEMTRGDTVLKDLPYLVKQKSELFLNPGESIPEEREEGVDYIQYRELKDPREITMLDPACGSMHFGLYCFDLYEKIYLEAWNRHNQLMVDLRDQYSRNEFIKQIPGLILRHNIHGVDIDPRAIQIAGLSLWLRCQRTFKELGLKADQRPRITKSNLVVAEPLPGNKQWLSEAVKTLEPPMRKLILSIWDKMKLAGELGLLLKIEEEIDQEIQRIGKELEKDIEKAQLELGAGEEASKEAQLAANIASKKYREEFLETAETEFLKSLEQLAHEAGTNGGSYSKLLFTEDTARGFSFIELCRNRYDVIFQNPPFGDSSEKSKPYIEKEFPLSKYDLSSVFVERMLQLSSPSGNVGSITTRTIFFLGYLTKWRSQILLTKSRIKYFVDLGGEVLDAMVETVTYVIDKGAQTDKSSIFFRATKQKQKDKYLNLLLRKHGKDVFQINTKIFKTISNEPFCYWVDESTVNLFSNEEQFQSHDRKANVGLKTFLNERFCRNDWEVIISTPIKWHQFMLTDDTLRFYYYGYYRVNWSDEGNELRAFVAGKNRSIEGESHFFRSGLSWAFRTAKFQPHIIQNGILASSGRFIAVANSIENSLIDCAFWNSEYIDYCLKLSMEKDYQPLFKNGTVNQLPYPKLPQELQNSLKQITKDQYYRVKELFRTDDKSFAFTTNKFLNNGSLNEYCASYVNSLNEKRTAYTSELSNLNQLVYDHFKINEDVRQDIRDIVSKAGEDDEGEIFDLTNSKLTDRIFSILIGCVFGRWDMRILKHWNQEWSDEDMFKARQHSPFFFGPRASTLDLVLPEYHVEIKKIWDMEYPIEVLSDIASVQDALSITSKLDEVIRYFWPETSDTIVYELQEHFGVKSLEEIFNRHSKFFDTHLKDYSRNKRISPIYWHLGVPSAKFNVWIYYPKIDNQTPYRIINSILEPKIEEVQTEVNSLHEQGGKPYNDARDFLNELHDFKEELLRVAELPYKPNHDDGVLITAAPLHHLFRHSKWKKATENCWKKLEKGEYDWAHLAYSIWPDRVRKKCVKDLSMAIAHGLEDICEVKPKEKRVKKEKEQKSSSRNQNQLKF